MNINKLIPVALLVILRAIAYMTQPATFCVLKVSFYAIFIKIYFTLRKFCIKTQKPMTVHKEAQVVLQVVAKITKFPNVHRK